MLGVEKAKAPTQRPRRVFEQRGHSNRSAKPLNAQKPVVNVNDTGCLKATPLSEPVIVTL
jgi:hypothetical protein